MHFLYFTRHKLTKIVQNPDWCNIQKKTFLTIYLKQNMNEFKRSLPSDFRNFQIEKLSKRHSHSQSPFNLDYFVCFSVCEFCFQ